MPNFNKIKILMIVQNRELLKIKKIRKFAKIIKINLNKFKIINKIRFARKWWN